MSNIEKIRAEIETRRQHMVNELMGHEEICEYYRIKGMHDAYVDLLTYLEYSLPDEHLRDSTKMISEDERIRKELKEAFEAYDIESKWNGIPIRSIFAWLEKQKEQKPTSTENMPYITDEHFFEREPADSFKYKLAEYMTKCCTKKEGPYGYEYGISAESILKMAEEELLKRGVVQMPAEWSEEDEEMLEYVIGDVNDAKQLYTTTRAAKDMADKEISWLKSLRSRPKSSDNLQAGR